MAEFALPCVVCGKELKNVDRDSDVNQPNAGTEFRAVGHYGSTIWDPGGSDEHGMELVLNVCDTCLLRLIDRQQVQSERQPGNTFGLKPLAMTPHPLDDQQRAWVRIQGYKSYGLWGEDEYPSQEDWDWYRKHFGPDEGDDEDDGSAGQPARKG